MQRPTRNLLAVRCTTPTIATWVEIRDVNAIKLDRAQAEDEYGGVSERCVTAADGAGPARVETERTADDAESKQDPYLVRQNNASSAGADPEPTVDWHPIRICCDDPYSTLKRFVRVRLSACGIPNEEGMCIGRGD